jgi:hypothetical protein
MAKFPRSPSFRSFKAAGVAANVTPTEFQFYFVDNEPDEVDTGDGQTQAAEIHLSPKIQAEVVINRDIAKWIYDFLTPHFKSTEESHQ